MMPIQTGKWGGEQVHSEECRRRLEQAIAGDAHGEMVEVKNRRYGGTKEVGKS